MIRPTFFALAGLATLVLAGCAPETTPHYLGYVEGEYVYVSSSQGGTLQRLDVSKGSLVESGTLLFALDPEPQALRAEEAEQRVRQARSRLDDLAKGARPSELAASEARLRSARAALERAEHDYERRRALHDDGHTDAVSTEELERYRADRDVRSAEVATLEAELETARLGGRVDALEVVRNEISALEAARSESLWEVAQKTVAAPEAGWIQDTLYLPGEYVPAGRPVVSLLPPGNVKVRFFVPQALLPNLAVGDSLEVRLDGMQRTARAEISFISSEAEFTPPVIYSKDSRAKLVFLVEALPDATILDRMRPGQPVEVLLDGANR